MDEDTQYIIVGRKTFFIVPDVSLLPESFLQDYLASGYETYIIGDDRYCPLQLKIEILLSVFTDAIFFFYIDTPVTGIIWTDYIHDLQIKYGETARFGVLYAKRQSEADRHEFEKYYLYVLGLQCGCIALEYQKAKNFERIGRVMYANQAAGRRRNVRAICDESSKFSFDYNNRHYSGRLCDVSMSHFTCLLSELPYDIPLYEKMTGISLDIQGFRLSTNAVLMMQRSSENGMLCIFLFTRPDGSQGLPPETAQRLLEKIYQMVSSKAKTLMRTLFDEAGRKYREKN